MSQGFISRYAKILKHHGAVDGVKRAFEQFTQVDMYDWLHGIETRQILTESAFLEKSSINDAGATSFYQPNYTDSTVLPLKFLVRNCSELGSTRLSFLDLGCGKGKVLHVAGRLLPRAKLFGVDCHPEILKIANDNLKGGARLILSDVLNVDYRQLLVGSDVVVVFNKNSFDRKTTETTLGMLRGSAPYVFYVYSNPVYADLFDSLPIYRMSGWHKNWNVMIWRI